MIMKKYDRVPNRSTLQLVSTDVPARASGWDRLVQIKTQINVFLLIPGATTIVLTVRVVQEVQQEKCRPS